MKMNSKPLKKLNLMIGTESGKDVSVIFAEPSLKDLEKFLSETYVLNLLNDILWTKDEVEEEDIKGEDGSKEVLVEGRNNKEPSEENSVMKNGLDNWMTVWEKERKKWEATQNVNDDIFPVDSSFLIERKKWEATQNVNDDIFPVKAELIEYSDNDEKNEVTKNGDSYYAADDSNNLMDNLGDNLLENFDDGINDDFDDDQPLGKRLKKEIKEEGKRVKKELKKKRKYVHRLHPKRNEENEEKEFKCKECGIVCAYKSSLIKHMKTLHKDVYREEKKPRCSIYSCDVCGKVFKLNAYLVAHTRIHTGEKPFSCEICGKAFSHRRSLIDHAGKHTTVKSYTCDICGKAFTIKKYLTRHNENIHSALGGKSYPCDVCGKPFTSKNYLRDHKRIHTGEKPFTCDVCGMAFSLRNYLINHTKVIHKGEKPYSCDVCELSFTKNANLVVHKRKHTGEKPYVCENCGKAFASKSVVIRHKKKVHSGEKLFSCDICQKVFHDNLNLARHNKSAAHLDRMKTKNTENVYSMDYGVCDNTMKVEELVDKGKL